MKPYNGYRSWNAWNVALWIGNDEGLYNLALGCIRTTKSRNLAARKMTQMLAGEKTPDGAIYNYTCIREALKGL